MHIDPIGYLFSVLNLSALGGSNFQLKDLAINVDTVSALVETLNEYPAFSIDKYRNKGYQRVNNIGIFLSKKVCEYMFEENVDPNTEGVMIVLEFELRKESTEKNPEEPEHHVLIASKHLHPDTAKTFLEYVNDKSS